MELITSRELLAITPAFEAESSAPAPAWLRKDRLNAAQCAVQMLGTALNTSDLNVCDLPAAREAWQLLIDLIVHPMPLPVALENWLPGVH